MSFDIRHMRHVIAVADHGSFVRAATALGLSQSALSRSVQSVESLLGSTLFFRTASGVEPNLRNVNRTCQRETNWQQDYCSNRVTKAPMKRVFLT